MQIRRFSNRFAIVIILMSASADRAGSTTSVLATDSSPGSTAILEWDSVEWDSARVAFDSLPTVDGGALSVSLDGSERSPVPEAGTLLLLLLGCAGLLLARKQFRSAIRLSRAASEMRRGRRLAPR